MNKILPIFLLSFCLSACQTAPEIPKPDVLLHEDKSELFWYQVWEREDGVMYIKELRRGTIDVWD